MKKILNFIFGRCKFICNSADAEKIFDLLQYKNLTTDPIKLSDDFCIVTLSEANASKLKKILDFEEIEYSFERLWGIPRIFIKYRHRPGIILGAILFFVIVTLSENIIWDFEIRGNKNISDTEIIEALEMAGCGAGDFIDDIDFDLLQNNCLIDQKQLAWISVNMDGNLARVEVREKKVVPVKSPPSMGRFANIIAAEDGVVELCLTKNGKAVVETGDVVKKGELLISGVIDIGDFDVRYEYADGEVLAKVYREIEDFVPFDFEKKTENGEKMVETQLKIFGKTINLSHRGSISTDVYGKIKEEEKLYLPFGISLPIWMTRTVYSGITTENVILSESKAVAIARERVSARLQDMTDTFQVTSVNEVINVTDKGVIVKLCLYGITDISANYGFTVSSGDTVGNEDKPQNEENHNS